MKDKNPQNIEQDSHFDDIVRSLDCYGDLAGSEALIRSLVAEHTGNRGKSLFWVRVFQAVAEREAEIAKV